MHRGYPADARLPCLGRSSASADQAVSLANPLARRARSGRSRSWAMPRPLPEPDCLRPEGRRVLSKGFVLDHAVTPEAPRRGNYVDCPTEKMSLMLSESGQSHQDDPRDPDKPGRALQAGIAGRLLRERVKVS